MRQAECLVIGGGLAGAMAAFRLRAAGREVLLVERERTTRHKVCGEFLSPEAIGYLLSAGVDPMALGAVRIRRVRISVGKHSVAADLPFTALSLSRCVLDAALLSQGERQGVQVERGICAQELNHDGQAWTLRCADGCVVQSRSAFLATGKHDLRGWTREPGAQNDLIGFKMHLRLSAAQTELLRGWMELFLFPGGYGGLSLIEGDCANLCFVVRRYELRGMSDWSRVLQRICGARRVGDFLEQAQMLWERPLAIAPIPYGDLGPSTEDDLWRLGDQGAVIPSFTGDGMSIALHSGALAAELYVSGATPGAYQRVLRAQLQQSMRLAVILSRSMVSELGRSSAPAVLAAFPHAMRWIAEATRIPQSALRSAVV